MTLKKRIKHSIQTHGPMRLDHYIETCLWDEEAGYYRHENVFGDEGDFVTAPEISPIFGQVIAIWAMEAWRAMDEPQNFTLLEMGAGRGKLMCDFLSIAKHDQAFMDAMNLFILEKSPKRRTEQAQKIQAPITFLDNLKLPDAPVIAISNEFFDALPIRQFRNEGGGWLEAFIDQNLEKIWQICPRPPKELARFWGENGIVEICQDAMQITSQLARHLKAKSGAMLTIDYGEFDGTGDTFQAVKNHQFVSPFDHLGEADLTAHLRFRDLAEAGKLDCDFMTQAEFIHHFGGEKLCAHLCARNPELATELEKGYHRLTDQNQMGALFKALIQRRY